MTHLDIRPPTRGRLQTRLPAPQLSGVPRVPRPRVPLLFGADLAQGGVFNRGKNLNMHMHMYHARVMCVCAYSFLLIAGCSLSLHGLQIPTEDRDSLRMAMESRNGHKLVARIMLRPSEVRSMTLTQALA